MLFVWQVMWAMPSPFSDCVITVDMLCHTINTGSLSIIISSSLPVWICLWSAGLWGSRLSGPSSPWSSVEPFSCCDVADCLAWHGSGGRRSVCAAKVKVVFLLPAAHVGEVAMVIFLLWIPLRTNSWHAATSSLQHQVRRQQIWNRTSVSSCRNKRCVSVKKLITSRDYKHWVLIT